MPKIAYIEEKQFRDSTLAMMRKANQIIEEYKAMGYGLSLRQLYYQFISLDYFPNTEKSYNKLGRVLTDGRMAGIIDWDSLEDRGREAHNTAWVGHEPDEQREIVRSAQRFFSLDLWEDQDRRVEVWVEKQALEEVVARAASRTRTAYFACKGYVSQSEMWAAGQRMRHIRDYGQEPLILHLGDHDPSGIDMTRDIEERLSLFAEAPVEVRRIALTMDQINEYQPPPNPAKTTDSRFASYRAQYGVESWELDAMRPEMLTDLITGEIEEHLDRELYSGRIAEEREGRIVFDQIADHWGDVMQLIEGEEED